MRRRKLNRLPDYDYSRDALYFVTSCVYKKQCFFGEIHDGVMLLNDCGQIAERQFSWLEDQYAYVNIDTFVVMPNHIHMILEIDRTAPVGTGRDLSLQAELPNLKIKPLSELEKSIYPDIRIFSGSDPFTIISSGIICLIKKSKSISKTIRKTGGKTPFI